MKAVIRFIEPDEKLAILTKLLGIFEGIEQLRQHVLAHGILLENLTPDEVEALKEALRKLDYSDYTATENFLRLKIARGDLSTLIRLVITIPGFGNDFAELFWERGFSIEKLTPNQADDLKRQLEPIAIVTITPDIADTPEPVVYTVSGEVRNRDGTPFIESGFTIHVFDSLSPKNLVQLGSVALNSQPSYHLSYSWKSDGRNGPNLVVRLVNPKGETVEEVRHSLAPAQAVLNITVKNLQPQSFILTARVKNQATGKILPNVQVEAQFRTSDTVLMTQSGMTDAKGTVSLPFDETLFSKIPAGRQGEVVFRIRQGNETLGTAATISNLQPGNQEVEILVSVPESTGEAFIVYGTIRWTSETLAPGLTVRAFDSVPAGNPVLLGSAVPDAKGGYRISYSWKSDGRNGPDLIVRLIDSEGRTISEARRQFATRDEIVNLAVEDSEKKTIPIKGRVERQTQDTASPASPGNISGLLIEAWDKYEILSEPLGKEATDQEGRFTITLSERQVRELFLGRRPDVFFRVSTGEEVLLDTRNSIVHNIAEVTREVALLIPVTQQTHPEPVPQPSYPIIMGTAVLSPGWEKDILIEAFADPELRQPLGMAKVGASGRFEIQLASPAARIWFRWSEGKKQGQSPTLQPFDAADLIRLHIVERYPAIPIDKEMGEGRYEGMVRSITGRPVIGTGVYLIEIALRRCQVLGNAVTDDTGLYRILYNPHKLFAAKPDLRVVVFGNDDIPLMESENSTVILPGRFAGTYSLENRVNDALRNEGILGAEDFQLTPGDIDYIASRTDLPQKAVAAYAAAANLASQLKIPQTALFALLNNDSALDPKAALEQAVEQDEVSPSVLRSLPDITAAIMSAAQERILTKDLGRGSIDDFLSLQIPDPTTRKEVAELMLDAPSGAELRAKLKERGILNSGLDFLLVIQSLTGVDVPLARVLSRSSSESGTSGSTILQSKTVGQWQQMLKESGLYDESGGVADNAISEKLREHARILKRRAEQLDPMYAFRTQLEQHANTAWAAEIGKYLAAHPQFELDSPEPPADPDNSSGIAAINAYKRVQAITDEHGAVGPLLDRGFISAGSIARIGPEEFTETFAAAFDGDHEAARNVHTRAVKKATALNLATSFLPLGVKPSLCGCPLCKSIFGPAAYLFELLLFLQRYSSSREQGGLSLLEHFEQHRPDVPHLRLSCPNTNIEVPQIDLLNEVLEDLILSRKFAEGECLPISRETQGTSEERRAIPQNEPSREVLQQLKETIFPWSLPYDYELDRAKSASAVLISKPEDLALELWRYASTSTGGSTSLASAALGRSLVGLSERQVSLIVETSPLDASWGGLVAADVEASRGVKFTDLKRVSGLTSEELEQVLDTAFVRGGDEEGNTLRLHPENPCHSDEELRLVGSPDHLTALLDRLQRFERLRRHLAWSVYDLGEALRWLSGPLDGQRLEQIGMLRFLELKLGISPERLLALFRDPEASLTPTLRPRAMPSPFERFFGANSAELSTLDPALDEEERAQQVSARIAQVSSESLATVDLVFSGGLLAPWQSISAMLSSPDLQTGYRHAACTTYRLAQWSSRLRLDESELLDLIQLAELGVMPSAAVPPDSGRQLLAALQLVHLADRKRNWPVDISELRYLMGGSPSATRQHSPTATEVGRELNMLRQELRAAQEAQKPVPPDAQAAVRTLLSRLLLSTPYQGEPVLIETKVEELAHQLEWSAFFSDLGTRFSEALLQLLPEWPGLSGIALPDATEAELTAALLAALSGTALPDAPEDELTAALLIAALDSLEPVLQDWLEQRFDDLSAESTTPWSDESFRSLATSLKTATTQALQHLDADAIPEVQANLRHFLERFRDTDETLHSSVEVSISRQFLSQAQEHVKTTLGPRLVARAALLLPLLEATMKRITARKVLAAWLSRNRAVGEDTANILLSSLSDPRDPSQPIGQAFVTNNGVAAPDLERSVIIARYVEVAETIPHPRDLVDPRLALAQSHQETSLAFDWSERPPQPGLQNRRFAAIMEVPIPTASLFENSNPVALVVETDGQVLVEIDVDGARRTLVDFDASGTPARASAAVAEYAGLDPTREVILHVRYISPPAARSKTFKLLKLSGDGQHDEFHWALVDEAVLRLAKASLGLRAVSAPPSTWEVLDKTDIPTRAIALDLLASDAPLEAWLRVFALNDLAKRIRSNEARKPWLTLLAGRTINRQDLCEALNLEEAELPGALQLLGVTDPSSDQIVLPAAVSLEHMSAVLQVADRARRLGLTAPTLAHWNDAPPAQIYQWTLAALRRGLEPSEWLKLLAEIYDPVREHLRDAQLDFARARLPAELFGSREGVSDYLLTDTQVSPCMTTSRIQFSYAAVQKYVDLALSRRLPGPAPAQEEGFRREWIRLSNYRLSEAQVRIKLTPENWIEPEIRPTKTPFWENFEQRLHSEPLTLHVAERAMREYAASLAEVSRLETIAIATHNQPDLERPLAFRDTELTGTHVFARTRAYPRRLYYRRRLPKPDGRWTPWERIDQDLEGTHYLAVIAFGRVRLICAEFVPAKELRPDKCATGNSGNRFVAAGAAVTTNYEVNLSWIDREHGKWSPVRRSGRFNFPISAANPPTENDLWPYRPDQHPDIIRESAEHVDEVEVTLRLGGDGIRSGGKMEVKLFEENEEEGVYRDVGSIYGEDDNHDSDRSVGKRWPEAWNVEKISRVRLNFHGHWVDDITNFDRCDIEHIWVRFMHVGRIVHPAAIPPYTRGKTNKSVEADYINDPNWRLNPLPNKFSAMGDFDGKAFEAELEPLELGIKSPELQDFQIEYEVLSEGLDLSKGFRIEASQSSSDSFTVQIHSLFSETDVRLRARFKVRAELFTETPEAQGKWPADWVTSSEFCFTYRTEEQPLASLWIQADDTVQLEGAPTIPAGNHPSTFPVGQTLVGFGMGNIPLHDATSRLASFASGYKLVVPRNVTVSGDSSPKVLEEFHSPSSAPARILFIERVGSVPLPVKDEAPTKWVLLTKQPSNTASQNNLLSGSSTPALLGGAEKESKFIADGAIFLPMLVFSPEKGTVITPGFTIANLRDDLIGQQHQEFGNTKIPMDSVRLRPHQSIWSFQTFWHPQAVGFRRIIEARGLPRLMRIANQDLGLDTDLTVERQRVDYFSSYSPTQFVPQPWPKDAVDFTIDGPFSEYNWELFHDSLVYLTKLFDADGKFEEADEIFSLMIDTAKAGNSGIWEDPELYRIAPIRRSVAQDRDGLVGLIEGGEVRPEIIAQIERINQNPYQPHIIARGWPSVYARALRIRFADHLIRAGEYHFRRAYQGDSRTDLELATTRFDFAVRVLGQPQDLLGMAEGDATPCFSSILHSRPDHAPRGIEVLEAYLPGTVLANSILSDGTGDHAHAHFCVPRDEKLDELRAVVADRLSKLRACQDIEGVRRALSLYGQRIDPALLVRATAEGIDLDVVLGQISSAKPTMYFSALWSRAMQACERARALEDAWVSAHERADSEGIALLQNEQEIQTLEMGVETSAQRLRDARLFVEALDRTIESAQLRYDFYSTRERISQLEKAEGDMLKAAGAADARAAADARSASDSSYVPTAEIFVEGGYSSDSESGYYARAGGALRYRVGGETAVQVYRANSEGHRNEGAKARAEAGLIGQSAARERRFDEWKLSESLAQKDIAKGERDKAAAEVRIQIADLELQLQKKRVDDAKALRTYMKDKFSNQQLYSWRASRLEQLRYQQQRIAYDLAMQAKAALARELGLENQGPLPDMGNGRTCAAAALSLELEKMQHTYVTTKRSERKKTKAYSLATRQPLAFLELLQRGETIFSIAEHEYDEDAAGDWYRTFNHISITVPAVHGPYSNVNVELTQLSGEIRRKPHGSAEADNYPRQGIEDDRFKRDLTTGERIATNTGLQDDGTVGTREDPETPPVFAGNGAISTFRIELKPEQNHFDRHTITDVILHLTINSRYGGESACEAGMIARRRKLAEDPSPVMLPLHSSFSNAWHYFIGGLSSERGSELTLKLDESHVPMHLSPPDRIVQTHLYFACPEEASLDLDDENIGEFGQQPTELLAVGGGPVPSLPIRRLKLRRPLRLGEEQKILFRKTDTAPKRGWLVCWVKGVHRGG
jgi:hypothetical protein